MKKMFIISLMALTLMAFSGSAFAANPNANLVAEMATQKGGQHIAECAQMHERGISHLATGNCEMAQ